MPTNIRFFKVYEIGYCYFAERSAERRVEGRVVGRVMWRKIDRMNG